VYQGAPHAAQQADGIEGYAAASGVAPQLPPTRVQHWGGYRLLPQCGEFWQGRKSRLHDRLRYTQQSDGQWLRERLAP